MLTGHKRKKNKTKTKNGSVYRVAAQLKMVCLFNSHLADGASKSDTRIPAELLRHVPVLGGEGDLDPGVGGSAGQHPRIRRHRDHPPRLQCAQLGARVHKQVHCLLARL